MSRFVVWAHRGMTWCMENLTYCIKSRNVVKEAFGMCTIKLNMILTTRVDFGLSYDEQNPNRK